MADSFGFGFMSRVVETHRRGVCSFYIEADMSAAAASYAATGMAHGSAHADVKSSGTGILEIQLKSPGQKVLGVYVDVDGATPHLSSTDILTEGKEVQIYTETDAGAAADTVVRARLDVSFAPDET